MPGVSTKMTCACGTVLTPRIRVRVVWGLGVTIASLAPTRELSKVDFPTFGRPTKATKPQRNCPSGGDMGVCGATKLHGIRLMAYSIWLARLARSMAVGFAICHTL